MKCPKNSKYCSPTLLIKAQKSNYICSGISTNPTKYKYVVCPKCGHGKMQYGYRGWECLWTDCCFSTNEIESEDYIRHLIQLKEDIKLIKKYKI